MSKFTTEVRYICEFYAGQEGASLSDITNIVAASHAQVIGEYPIFDENYRESLDSKILKHYYTREICEETFGLWKLRINNRMNEIMPYYNKLYESELIKFNPLYDFGYTRSKSGSKESDRQNTQNTESNAINNSAESTNSNNTSSTNSNIKTNNLSTEGQNQLDKYSDTPQGSVNNLDNYITNARAIENNKSSSDTSTSKGSSDNTESSNESTTKLEKQNSNLSSNQIGRISDTESYIESVMGKQGSTSYSKLLIEFRETFLNIDKMIIEELSDLFFGLWE